MILIVIILVISSAVLWYDLYKTQNELDRRSKLFSKAIAELDQRISDLED